MGEQIGKGGCSPCTVITSKFLSVHCSLFCLFDFSSDWGIPLGTIDSGTEG